MFFHVRYISFALVLISFLSAVQGAEVRFQKRVTVSTSMITLGEIAQLKNGTEQQLAALSKIVLMPGPTPGETTRVDFQLVRSRLQALGVNLSQVQFSGSSVVLVTRKGNKVGHQQGVNQHRATSSMKKKATELVLRALQQHLRGKGVTLTTQKVDIQLDERDITLILAGKMSGYKIEGGAAPWQNSQLFVAKFQDRNEKIQQVRFRASVVPKQRVLAARFALPRGHIIKADDLTMKPIDNENLPVIRFEEIIGTETTRAIGQNKSITKQDVKSVPLVRSNDIVTVTSRVGGISVRRQMKSRGNASRGETVTLISLDGRQSLQATVTAFHEAEIAGTSPKHAKYRESSGSQILFQAPVASNNRDHVANYRQTSQLKRTEPRRMHRAGVVQAAYQQRTQSNSSPMATHQRPSQIQLPQFMPGKYQRHPLPKENRSTNQSQQFRGR